MHSVWQKQIENIILLATSDNYIQDKLTDEYSTKYFKIFPLYNIIIFCHVLFP